MKNKWLIASILIVALIGLCSASIFATWQGVLMAQDNGVRFRGFNVNRISAKATEEKTLNVSGPTSLKVANSFGNITVETGTDDKVVVKAEKTAWGSTDADAQAGLKDLKVVITQDGNNISISVEQPAVIDALHIGPGIGSVKFTISVPQETTATLHSSNGDVSLEGTTGSADVQSDFGDVTITDVNGEVLGKSNNGKITARELVSEAKITLSSDFGSIKLEDATGSDVSASSANGQIDLTEVNADGLLKASSQFGSIHVGGSQAQTADVRSSNGSIRLENLDVEGSITVKSNFGGLTLSKVNARSYDLDTQNGRITVTGAQNEIKAHSSFGSIEVLDAENATLNLSSNNGKVTFSGSLGSGPHILKSNFGNIEVTLPANSALDIDMQTDFGKITSDFAIAISGKIDNQDWDGTINGGGAQLSVETNNGNISLQSLK